MQKLTRSFLLAGAAFGLAACGDDVSVTPPTPAPASVVTGVTVSPATISIAKGQTVVATAQVTVSSGTGTPDRTVTWSSADANIASVGAATGAITGVNPGTTTIRATAGGVTGAATVTVTLGVQSVSVTPTSVSLQVGQKATPTAVVTRDAGVAGTVTWTSGNTAVATVAASGEITAVAVGTTTVTAASTVDPSKTAALSVVVTAVPNNLTGFAVAPTSAALGVGGKVKIVPNATTVGNPTVTYAYSSSNTAVATVDASGEVTAVGNGSAIITTTATTSTNSLSATTTISVASASVSISTITQGGLGAPVNIANVAGQIEVTMNIAAGNQTLDSVRVTLGGQPAATQTFTVNGAPNAPVTLSINTAAYKINADSTSTTSFVNGSTGVQAQLFTQGSSGPTASNTITITLNNQDTFHARWTLPTTSTTDANGLLWYGGPATTVTVNVVPVMYTGNTVSSATIHLDDASDNGNAAEGNDGAKVDAAAPFVQTFTTAGVENPAIGPGVAASLLASGNPGPVGRYRTNNNTNTAPFANNAALAAIRVDGVAPSQPAVTPNPNGRLNNWVNDAVSFVTVISGSNPDALINGASTDFGVGGVTYIARAGTDSATTAAAASITNATTLARSLADAYCLFTYSKDALGNVSDGPSACGNNASGSAIIGVDRDAPQISYDASSVAANAQLAASPFGTEFVVTVNDTGVVGNSGMLAGAPVRASVQRRTPAGTACVVGSGASCAQTATGLAVTLPTVSTAITAQTTEGYYTFAATAYDAAGNSQAISASRVVIFDYTAPALTPFSLSLASNFYNGGVSQTFSAFANDNIDVESANAWITYPSLPANIYLGSTTLNTFNASTLLTSNVPLNVTIPFFLRSVSLVTGNAPLVAGAQAKPTGLSAELFDQAGNTSGVVNSAFSAASIVNASATAFTGAWSWSVTPSAVTVSRGAATPTSITFTADLFGPTATFNTPFARVEFYAVDVNGDLRKIGTATSFQTDDDGSANGRRHRYTFVWTVGSDANFASGTVIHAIGSTSSGDALVTPATAAITINP